jgi:hypothetical protein
MGNVNQKAGADKMQYYPKSQHPRKPYKKTLEITIPSQPQKGTLLAVSANISDIGICIYTFKPLKEGQEIVFKSTLPVPHGRAIVRWVKQCNPDIYKAGVLLST